MESLGSSDLAALRDAMGALQHAGSPSELVEVLVARLRELLEFDVATIEELTPGGPMRQHADPAYEVAGEYEEYFSDHLADHPMIGHFLRTGDVTPHRFGDFLTDRQLHELPIYHELFSNIGIERQAGFPTTGTEPPLVGVTVSRESGTDFSSRDLAVLSLLQPMVVSSFRVASIRNVLVSVARATERGPRVAVLGEDEVVIWASEGVRRQFEQAFGTFDWPRLPADARNWIAALGSGGDAAAAFLGGRGPERSALRLRYLPPMGQSPAALVIESAPTPPTNSEIRALGLTARQADVMTLVLRGMTTRQIADELFVSVATVRKHLERIYAELGVHSRAEATAAMWKRLNESAARE